MKTQKEIKKVVEKNIKKIGKEAAKRTCTLHKPDVYFKATVDDGCKIAKKVFLFDIKIEQGLFALLGKKKDLQHLPIIVFADEFSSDVAKIIGAKYLIPLTSVINSDGQRYNLAVCYKFHSHQRMAIEKEIANG